LFLYDGKKENSQISAVATKKNRLLQSERQKIVEISKKKLLNRIEKLLSLQRFSKE